MGEDATMMVLTLFLVFFKIGLFAIGGAYSFLPLLERELVERYQWISKEEFLEILAIVKVIPGAISIKYATYTGYKIAGLWGVIAANLGNLFAPILLIFFAMALYTKYKDSASLRGALSMIQLAMFAMIVAVAFQLINIHQLIQWKSLLFAVTFFILFFYAKIHPALLIAGAGIIGFFLN